MANTSDASSKKGRPTPKRKDAQSAHEAAGRIIDAIDVLKTKRPEVADAMKAEAKLLSEWMGSDAVKLVNKVQQS